MPQQQSKIAKRFGYWGSSNSTERLSPTVTNKKGSENCGRAKVFYCCKEGTFLINVTTKQLRRLNKL